jgi:hypothetical protein
MAFREPSVALLNSDQLKDLCPSSCVSDLTSLVNTIENSCKASTDVMVPDGITAYPGKSSLLQIQCDFIRLNIDCFLPATFLAKRLIYTAALSCLTDP